MNQHSLRLKVALIVALPLLLILLVFSAYQYRSNRELLNDLISQSAEQLGEVAVGSLRHAFIEQDSAHVRQILQDLTKGSQVINAQIIGLDSQVHFSESPEIETERFGLESPGCIECHSYPAEQRPHTSTLRSSPTTLRATTPIAFEAICGDCHMGTGIHLGVLLLDLSWRDLQQERAADLQQGLLASLGGTLLVSVGAYFLVHWIVVRRVEGFIEPLRRVASGDFSVRIPETGSEKDELGMLARRFNQMVINLEELSENREARGMVRKKAIIEERERIAHELHDGLGQLLGYVNTKAMAVRLLLQGNRPEAAQAQLHQLEEASREVFTDVRQAILSLRMSGEVEGNLPDAIRGYAEHFSRMSDIPLRLEIDQSLNSLSLPAEIELQMLRIIQEALTNIRKHSEATQATVLLQNGQERLTLTIMDNGAGFQPGELDHQAQPRFGLSTMRERAESIGAQLEIQSASRQGTRVTIVLPLKEI